MQLAGKILALFGWAFVICLGTLMIIINVVPLILWLHYCVRTGQSPREVIELVLPE